jgi:hypothetical protein
MTMHARLRCDILPWDELEWSLVSAQGMIAWIENFEHASKRNRDTYKYMYYVYEIIRKLHLRKLELDCMVVGSIHVFMLFKIVSRSQILIEKASDSIVLGRNGRRFGSPTSCPSCLWDIHVSTNRWLDGT